jgi:hypothetical protein
MPYTQPPPPSWPPPRPPAPSRPPPSRPPPSRPPPSRPPPSRPPPSRPPPSRPPPATLVKTPRPRKPLTKDGLATAETTLRAKYPHIIEGSLRNATKNQPTDDMTEDEVAKFHHKRSVRIHCLCHDRADDGGARCPNTRRVATSDLAQVAYCEDCTRANRNARKRARRAKAKQK